MTKLTIFDAEANGLLNQADKAWCICTLDYHTDSLALNRVNLHGPRSIDRGLQELYDSDVLIGHNIIDYDLRLFKMLYDWEPKGSCEIVDTVVYSRALYPKRPPPPGCAGNKPHSIDTWGQRVGMAKPEHEDWSQYSPEMANRCKRDVVINYLVLKELEEEADEENFYYQDAG